MTAVPDSAVHAPEAILLGFARALRAAGVPVTTDRERTFLDAVAAVGLSDERGVYVAGRATLCAAPDDLERFDQVYAAWFGGEIATWRSPNRPRRPRAQAGLEEGGDGASGDGDDEALTASTSRVEVLRHRDIATLTQREKRDLAALFAGIPVRQPMRASPRRRSAPRGRIDAHATLRDQLRRMGEPGRLRWRRRTRRPRRVVLLIDISGSMNPYADSLLRLAHRLVHGLARVDVFTLGTRLTQVTRALATRDPDRALIAAGEVVPDWSGGTRLGDNLAVFLDRWGRRGLARGAIVVVFSDGWERDQPEALGEQVRRLRAVAHRVVWVNPHRGRAGYEPVQGGIMAVLPHVDDFVAGHSMAAFQELTEVVARA